MESRALLSGFAFTPPDAAVMADLAKIKTDTTALVTEIKTLAPTLKTDEAAIQTAIKAAIANDSTVQTAQATLKTEITTAQTTIKADFAAIKAATTSTAKQAAFKQLQSDETTLGSAIQTDETAVQTAINADSGVATAEAKFNTDAAPIVADEATLQGDYSQLFTDLKAEYGGGKSTTSTALG
jgi:hypothetical protein